MRKFRNAVIFPSVKLGKSCQIEDFCYRWPGSKKQKRKNQDRSSSNYSLLYGYIRRK